MVNVLFFLQYRSVGSSSRGIQSGGVILDFGDLCDEQYIRSLCKGRYKFMYQVGRNYLKDLKSMQLSEFEAIFYPKGYLGTLKNMQYLLGFSDLESPFRKEILQKYGALANECKPKTTTVYNAGQIIKGVDNVEYVYVGNFEEVQFIVDKTPEYKLNGHMYIPADSFKRKYGSLTTASAMSSLDILGDYLMGYLNSYSRLERYFLNNKRKATEVNNSMVALNVSYLLSNGGANVISRVAKRNVIYGYNRNIEIKVRYKLK